MSRGEGAGSRYLKVVCRQRGCGCQVRVTRKWLELGAPRCPITGHGSMELEDSHRSVWGLTRYWQGRLVVAAASRVKASTPGGRSIDPPAGAIQSRRAGERSEPSGDRA